MFIKHLNVVIMYMEMDSYLGLRIASMKSCFNPESACHVDMLDFGCSTLKPDDARRKPPHPAGNSMSSLILDYHTEDHALSWWTAFLQRTL